MSGAFDKKTDGANRREARVQKELKEKRKIRILSVSVVSVLAVLFIGALFINSKYIRRILPAISIGGVDFSAVEFDYFFNNAYREYVSYMNDQFGEYASSFLPSTDTPLSSQPYDPETGLTWADFFKNYAIEKMTVMVQYHNAAKAAGHTLSDEKRLEIDDEVEALVTQAALYQYSSIDAMLQALYGPNINEKSFRKVIEFVYTALDFTASVYDSFTYSQEELTEYYLENRDTMDLYKYRYFLVAAETLYEDEFETPEDYDAANEAAFEAARELAAQIADGISSEDDMIAAAAEYDESAYGKPDSTLIEYPGTWLSDDYAEWMKEPGRQYGDVTTVDVSTGTYVIFFVNRDPNEYRMTEMRQILILREDIQADDFEDGEDDPLYQEAVFNAEIEVRNKAEEVLGMFVEGGATEEKLLDLMGVFSDDSTEGGFYDQISKDMSHKKMVKAIEDWLFDPARVYGDYELIMTEEYGYHLIFFMGHGERYCDFAAESSMRERDYNIWLDGLDELETVKRWAFRLAMV